MSPIGIPLDSKKINDLLKSHYWRVNVVESTGSTQVDLVKKVRDGQASSGDVLVTEFQSAGRGRLDRTFVTPSRSALLFSFYIEPKNYGDKWGWLPLLVGQAVCSATSKVLNLSEDEELKLKWPNDVLLNNKKVAGLLTERVETAHGAGVVVGIGINVHAHQEELPVFSATSFFVEGFARTDRSELLVEILNDFLKYLQRWESNDVTLLAEYCASSATIGRNVAIELPGGEKVTAIASSIDATGALVLDNGRHITVGDIVHIVSA